MHLALERRLQREPIPAFHEPSERDRQPVKQSFLSNGRQQSAEDLPHRQRTSRARNRRSFRPRSELLWERAAAHWRTGACPPPNNHPPRTAGGSTYEAVATRHYFSPGPTLTLWTLPLLST